MSRSNPPRSNIAESLSRNSALAGPTSSHPRPLRRRLAIRFAALIRWMHIYLSMFGLAVVLFFSVTGITLNHPDWTFGEAERRDDVEGRMSLKWLHREGPEEVARLEVVEHLRKTHGVRGAMSEFRTDERECLVTFRGPGYSADTIIDRESGRYSLSQTYHGLIAVVNDLHKGRDTGKVWSLVIDLSAVLMTLISLTGLALLFYLKLRRKPGLVVTLIGTAAVVIAYLIWVP